MTTYTSPFAGDVVLPTDVSYASYSISADLTLVWPINGNISTNVAARIMDITPSTSGLSVLMPPANQVSVGQDAFIKNPSAFTLTIKSSTGATLGTITAGGTRYFYITNNSTASGTWSNIALGIGTSSPDATTLAGFGLQATGATLNQTAPVSSVTAGYTFLSTDRAQTKVWGGGTGSATLPIASSLGNNWFCFFKNNGTGTLTISTTGLNTIDLGASKAFQPNESCIIICDGAEFVTVGYGTSTRFLFSSITKEVTAGAYTLTATEGTSLIQEYVGTLSSNVTVTYPPVALLDKVTIKPTIDTTVVDEGIFVPVTICPAPINALVEANVNIGDPFAIAPTAVNTPIAVKELPAMSPPNTGVFVSLVISFKFTPGCARSV